MTDANMPINLEELLDGIDMPCTKAEIISKAEDENGSREAMNLLQALPEKEFETLDEINKDLALSRDLPGHENQWPSEEDQELLDTKQHDVTQITGKGQV